MHIAHTNCNCRGQCKHCAHLYAQRAAWQSDSLVIGLLNLLGMMMIDWPLVSPPALAVTIMIFADDAKRIARHTSRPT